MEATATKRRTWIPVERRMPDTDRVVEVKEDGEVFTGRALTEATGYPNISPSLRGRCFGYRNGQEVYFYRVSHWRDVAEK